jgi:hypothetical protein
MTLLVFPTTMKPKAAHYFKLQTSEAAILQAAAQIFSGYVASGAIRAENETDHLRKSAAQAIALARHIDGLVESDAEMSEEK